MVIFLPAVGLGQSKVGVVSRPHIYDPVLGLLSELRIFLDYDVGCLVSDFERDLSEYAPPWSPSKPESTCTR